MAMPLTAQLAGPAGPERRSRSSVAGACVVAAAGAAACVLSLAAPPLRGLPMHPLDQSIHVAVAAAYLGAGVIAMIRRPGSSLGRLLALVGFLWLVGDLGWIPAALPATIALTYANLYQPALAHVVYAYPRGRLPDRTAKVAVAVAYGWTLLNNPVRMLFDDPRPEGCTRCPANLLLVHSDASLTQTLDDVTTWVGVVLIVVIAALIIRNWRRASIAARRVMAPAGWSVIPAAAYLIASEVASLGSGTGSAYRFIFNVLPIGLAVLPVGFLLGLSRTQRGYAQLGALLPQLAGTYVPGNVRSALARALGDPDLDLLYWSPTVAAYVDSSGNTRDPAPGPGRCAYVIDADDGPSQ